LSEGEADPLVVKEALIAGLGLVISECATANLDLSMPFITVVPNNKLHDTFYVSDAVWKNRKTSIALRDEIRDYGLLKFSWKTVIKRYINLIK
jgi:glycosyltransferase involved in cell wall biosynthesis